VSVILSSSCVFFLVLHEADIIIGACLKSLPEQSKESACASYTTKAAVQLGLAPYRPP
jgi:hypothetical protein